MPVKSAVPNLNQGHEEIIKRWFKHQIPFEFLNRCSLEQSASTLLSSYFILYSNSLASKPRSRIPNYHCCRSVLSCKLAIEEVICQISLQTLLRELFELTKRKISSKEQRIMGVFIFRRTFQHTQSDRLSALSLLLPRSLLQSTFEGSARSDLWCCVLFDTTVPGGKTNTSPP